MQMTAICFVVVSSINNEKKVNSVFSSETEYVVAKEDNIIVFVLDCLARDYMDDVRKESPDILDDWHDLQNIEMLTVIVQEHTHQLHT